MSSGARVFEVVIVKEGAFGVTVDETQDLCRLRVKAVQAGGCFERFNQATPESAICAGDLVTSINGGAATAAALAATVEGEKIRFMISREPPQAAAPQPMVIGAEECGERRVASPQAAAAKFFEVILVKEGAFGVTINEMEDPSRLRVKAVQAGGCFERFNQATPESAICAGDLITSINGGAATAAALAATVEGEKIRFMISCEPPEGKDVAGRALPHNVPPGSSFEHEKYVGPYTTALAIGCCCCIFACPIDERDVYIAPDGRKFTESGAKIQDGATAFEVVVLKEGAFGVTIDELEDPSRLRVKAVQAGGCVERFNQATPESAIRAGDLVTSINGGAATAAALAATVEGGGVRLTISREPPQAADVAGSALPNGVPPGSSFEHEKYIGPNTTAFGLGCCLCLGCFSCLVFACPIDERDVYVAPDGRKFTEGGAEIEG